ncbi:hypothetical protein HJFPF1_06013 [Paramyrothecium foliicola]|nr:hypothetical protein HJFPF1_06013 [Paramyrothecium foliicola]
MKDLLPSNFVPETVTRNDIVIASLAWGFTLGIGWLTTWTAMQQTRGVIKRRGWAVLRNTYIIMIWLEILVCLAFGIICFMHLMGAIPPSFAFYFSILTLWALQVQFLLQIIINRCAILVSDKKFIWRIKYGVAALITIINISVYCIWVPARLQISQTYIHVNEVWDRCEKGIYLVVDACLNVLFIRIVNQNLVSRGLLKYKGLVTFNIFIIGFSLSMDVLIIAMMSLDNTFVYMQFHPLAYIVKLNIEMSMASLIAKVARSSSHEHPGISGYAQSSTRDTRRGTKVINDGNERADAEQGKVWATVTTTVEMESMKAKPADHKANIGLQHDDETTLIDQGSFIYGHDGMSISGSNSPNNGRVGGSLSSGESSFGAMRS